MRDDTIDAMARTHWDTERRPGDSTWDELTACPEGSVGARHVERMRAKMRAAVDALQAPDLTDIRDRAASIVAWRKQHRDGDMPAAEALERAGSDAEGIEIMCAEMARTGGWRPIETAPDVGGFLVYLPGDRMPTQVCRSRYTANKKVMRTVGNLFLFDLSVQPSHWMPLPAAPDEDGG